MLLYIYNILCLFSDMMPIITFLTCMIPFLQSYERQIGRKHPRYYATTRLGRNLKDRCTKTDPEREVLSKMLDELKTKWTSLRTEISQKYVRHLHLDVVVYFIPCCKLLHSQFCTRNLDGFAVLSLFIITCCWKQ